MARKGTYHKSDIGKTVFLVAKELQEMSESVEKEFPYMDKNDNLMIERGITFARQYVLNLAPTIIPAEECET